MIVIGRASAEALERLEVQGEQGSLARTRLADPTYVAALVASDWTYMATDGDEVICAGGVVEWWPDRGYAWSLMSPRLWDDRRAWFAVHRAAVRMLSVVPYRRVEAAVAVNFTRARRWVERLGFELEAPCMRAYSPDGTDCALYARVGRV